MPNTAASPYPERFLFVVAAFGLTALAPAQTALPHSGDAPAPTRLAPFVVSATRTPQDPATLPQAVTSLDPAELSRLQVPDLASALATVPGLQVSRTGATGAQASVFIRGNASHHTLFVVDGIRLNDRTSPYFNALGGATLGGLERLEVLRGPQSTLYGSTAAGGVIVLETAHGCGPLTGKAQTVVGTQETLGGAIAAAGGTRTWGYSAQVDHFRTANDRPWNDFSQTSGAARLEYAPRPGWVFGGTVRVAESAYEEPGPRVWWASPSLVNQQDHLITSYARLRLHENFSTRLTLGQHQRSYLYRSAFGGTELRNQRRVLDWQTTATPSDRLEVTGGANLETSHYRNNLSTRAADRTEAAFVTVSFRPWTPLQLNAGARYDNLHTFNDATTGRAGAAWLFLPGHKVRTTYGTGFIAPGIDDRFGVAGWGQRPNPGLRPERAQSWDFGYDGLFFDRLHVSTSYFSNRIRDLFEWQTLDFNTFEGTIINRQRAKIHGVETEVTYRLSAHWRLSGTYTYLDARDEQTHQRLNRRAHHVGQASLLWTPSPAWEVGLGGRLQAGFFEDGRANQGFGTGRFFARWKATSHLNVSLRVENATDREYEEIKGYPALPRQLFTGVEWSF